MSTDRQQALEWIDRFRYFALAVDPGLLQLKHAAKTVIAVVIALEAFRFLQSRQALYAGMAAGFLMQSTAGTARRTRMITMACMGGASTVAVGLGSEFSGEHIAKQVLLVMAAFAVFYVRRYIPGKAMFPIFGFTLTLLATVQPGGAGSAPPMMASVFGGFVSAFAIFFYVLPDEDLRAFRNAADLFLFRLQHARNDLAHGRGDLLVLHRAIAFEEEERDALRTQAPELCGAVLANQYEALQALILLYDIKEQPQAGAAQARAVAQSRAYLDQVSKQLELNLAAMNA